MDPGNAEVLYGDTRQDKGDNISASSDTIQNNVTALKMDKEAERKKEEEQEKERKRLLGLALEAFAEALEV